MTQQSSNTIGKIAAALLKAQRNMGDATKGSKNPFFKSSYADLNSVREAATPALNAEGIVLLQPTVHLEGKNFVRTLLLHESGEWLSSDTEIVQAKLNDPQAHGSGLSYARRYGLQSFLNIGAVDDDSELAMGRGKPFTKQVDTPVVTITTAQGPTSPLPTTTVTTKTETTKRPTFKKPPSAPAATTTSDDWSD
jgi:hypothetical protein